jgi:hypothetical protein
MKNYEVLVKPLVYVFVVLMGTLAGYMAFTGTLASAYASVSDASNRIPVVKDVLPAAPPTWPAALAGGIGAALGAWFFFGFLKGRLGKPKSSKS